jgi:hypothetical protein
MCGNTAQKRNKKEEKKKKTKEKRIKNTVKKATSQKNGKKETATQWSKQERGNSHVTKFGQKETATQRSKKERGASHVTRTDLKTKSLGRFLLLCLLALPGAAAATSRTNSTSALEKQFRPGPLGPHGTRPLGVLSHGVVGSWNGNALAAESSPLTAPLQLAADAEQMWCSPVSDYDEPWASIARVVEFLGCSVSNNPHKWLLSFLIWLGCTIKVGQFFDPPKGFRRRLLIGCRFVGRQRKKHVRWKITSRKKLRHRSKFHLKSRTHDIPVAMFRRNNCCDSLWPDMSPQYLNFLKSDRLVGGGYSKKNPWVAKRRKGNKAAESNAANAHTRDVIAVLKQCLNHGISMDDVWAFLQQKVPQQSKPSKVKKTRRKPSQSTSGTEPRTKAQVRQWTDYQGNTHQYTVDETGWWSWLEPVSAAKPQPVAEVKSKHSSTVLGRDGCWVSSLRISDWDSACVPKLVSFPKVRASIKEGKEIPGNVIEIWDAQSYDELQTLWDCFALQKGATVLLCGPAKSVAGACHTKMSLSRGGYGHKLEAVALAKLGTQPAPWFPTAKRVEMTTVPKVERHTLRIAAPDFFRQSFLGPKAQDSQTQVIVSLAELGRCSVSEFYGGRWSTQTKPEGKQLVVFLRLKKPLRDTLLEASGQHGLFMTAVADKNEEKSDIKPFWIARNPKEDHESYLRRVLTIKKERKQVILFRFGTGDILGFPKKITDSYAPKARLHIAHGIPNAWGAEDVENFLGRQDWKQIEQLSRRGKTWFFKATGPGEAAERAAWQYEIFGAEETRIGSFRSMLLLELNTNQTPAFSSQVRNAFGT